MRSPPILENSYGGLLQFFFNNSGRDACAKQATQDLSRIQHSRQREKENPEIKQHEHLPNKIPHYSRVSRKSNFVANFLDQFRFIKCE